MAQTSRRQHQAAVDFGPLLRLWRTQAGLTQERLARRTGLSSRTIRALENGQAHPRAETARLLADAFGLDGRDRAGFHAAAHRSGDEPQTALRAALGLPTGLVVPAQLPADVAGFTGRGQHLRELDALLSGAGGRQAGGWGRAVVISAIAGTAGVGKSALAVHWAHQVRELFPDGQLYVNLHGWAQGRPLSSLQALAQLLGALGVAADRIPVETEQAAALYRSLLADRRVLVIADNARDAAQVRPLIPGTPGCLVVVTSRDRLGGLIASHGAVPVALDVLTPGEAVGMLARVLGEDRVAAEAEAAAELAEVCGFLPLALRIAAANLAGQPDQPIARWLGRVRAGDRLTELAVSGDPQAAVRTAFDSSYAALDPDARRLFRLLGLAPGRDFTPEAAAALAGLTVAQAARLLQRLAGAHLIEPRGPERFGFHDLLRLYAHQRAEEDGGPERERARNRLLGWYLHTTEAAARLLHPHMVRLPVPPVDRGLPAAGFEDRSSALGCLDAERPNLVAATQHAATNGPRPLAWLLADALRGYFWETRHMVDWLTVANAALAAAEAEGDLHAQVAVHRSLGMICQCQGDHARAAEHHARALPLSRQAGWVDGEAALLGNLAMAYTSLGQLERAADHHAQALALYRQSGRKSGQATALANLGDVLRQLGQPGRAAEHLTASLVLDREANGRVTRHVALGTLGEVYRDLGRLDDAAEHLTQALTLARAAGGRYGEAYNLNGLATVHRDAGRLGVALELSEAAVSLAREIGDPRVQADALNTLGSVQLALGDGQQAARQHRAALDLARETDARFPHAEALLGLAATCQRQGQHHQAIEHAEQARVLAREATFRILEGRAHGALAAVHLDLDDGDQAVRHARKALAIFRASGHRPGHAAALAVLGHATRRAGR
jgi:tetratricopeptide (TPR) repeat protein/transcriptional regulator with XRE-family HTH domain